jgi:monoamine oxidase
MVMSMNSSHGREPPRVIIIGAGVAGLAASTHDWQADPFSRGAYSYIPLGGLGARKILAEPVEETLHWAGEATHFEGEAGTVAGAIATGYGAAREVLVSRSPQSCPA